MRYLLPYLGGHPHCGSFGGLLPINKWGPLGTGSVAHSAKFPFTNHQPTNKHKFLVLHTKTHKSNFYVIVSFKTSTLTGS